MNEDFILRIIDKINSSSIGELELDNGTFRLVLRKEHTGIKRAVSTGTEAAAPAEIQIQASAAAEVKGGDKITSPIVATFYAAPGPDTPPFVKPGQKIKTGQTLCILEAMKMMNHLNAEFDCEIIEVLAKNGDLVEYDQPLFIVKKS